MEVHANDKDASPKDEVDEKRTPPTLVTTVTALAVADIPRAELAVPPLGFTAATGPFQFGEDGQTLSEDALAKLPPEPGEAPKTPKK